VTHRLKKFRNYYFKRKSNFEIYQGIDTLFQDKSLGLVLAVVLHLSQSIPEGSVLFFDRYFTTVSLLDRLLSKGIKSTGTIMSNRLKNVHFSQDKNFKEVFGRSSQGVKIKYLRPSGRPVNA